MAIGRPLGAKVFLEGHEVPLIGATITHTVGQASIAYIDLVPQGHINHIKPRTHVMLSVRDYNDRENEYPYVLAWEGEVFGYSFGKSAGSRSFTIQCIDLTGYWDNALTYFLSPQSSLGRGVSNYQKVGAEIDTANASGAKVNATSTSSSTFFLNTIEKVLKEDGKNFLDAFKEVYKSIGSINEFFKNGEERFRISDRLILKSSGKLHELLKNDQASKWYQGIINNQGGFATLRNVIQMLMGTIFHDFVSIPFPARVAVKGFDNKKPGLKSIDKKTYTVGQLVFKPNLYMVPPPMCNVFFPDEYSSFQYSRNFFAEPTRMMYRPEVPLFMGGENIVLTPIYEPDSFENFMDRDEGDSKFPTYTNSSDFGHKHVPIGTDEKKVKHEFTEVTNGLVRSGAFLTNEEQFKGIWLAVESTMPASSEFTSSVTDTARRDVAKRIGKYLFLKKRFEGRSLQITSHLKLSVVPGFNVLVLDDSEALQHTMAYCSSVTHRIHASEGGYTNVTLSYARLVDEQESASTTNGEPPIPSWYDEVIFGAVGAPPPNISASPGSVAGNEAKAKAKGKVLSVPVGLSAFYADILGAKGSKALTSYSKGQTTITGSVAELLKEYRQRKAKGSEDLQSFISSLTDRDYVRVRDAMTFIGATDVIIKDNDLRSNNFNVFGGGAFSTKGDWGDAVKARSTPIHDYVSVLKSQRGLRG